MYRLLILDDEEDICQAIAQLVDWESLGIALIGACQDSVEAYHMILDEAPDIVLTDIEMPGISGLDLIERIANTNLPTEFVILSGYDQFEYAKRAMRCGVRYYLLKPCDEKQILECMSEVINDLKQRNPNGMTGNLGSDELVDMQQQLIYNIIREGIYESELRPEYFEAYNHYTTLAQRSFWLCSLYFLEEKNLKETVRRIHRHFSVSYQNLYYFQIYVNNILLLFFPDSTYNLEEMDLFLGELSFSNQSTSMKYTRVYYTHLSRLLYELVPRIRRFDKLFFISRNGTLVPNYNHETFFAEVDQLIPELLGSSQQQQSDAFQRLEQILSHLTSRDYLIQLSNALLITLVTQKSVGALSDISGFLYELQQMTDLSGIREAILSRTRELLNSYQTPDNSYSPFILDLIEYLSLHLEEPDLTLKWIADHHLYMNVNYVGKCFQKETGQKFSSFLVNLRIRRAKEIFREQPDVKISDLAMRVGCGNNPYYFTKIFKKATGITPTAYARKISAAKKMDAWPLDKRKESPYNDFNFMSKSDDKNK